MFELILSQTKIHQMVKIKKNASHGLRFWVSAILGPFKKTDGSLKQL